MTVTDHVVHNPTEVADPEFGEAEVAAGALDPPEENFEPVTVGEVAEALPLFEPETLDVALACT